MGENWISVIDPNCNPKFPPKKSLSLAGGASSLEGLSRLLKSAGSSTGR
jgi:hypothetical protein